MRLGKNFTWIGCGLALCLLLALGQGPARAADVTVRVGKAQAETFSFVPLDVGIAAGLYKKHGIAIDPYNFGGSAKLQQALAADAIDVGLGSGPELAFVAKGAPVLGVAAMADAPWLIDLVVLKNGPVKTVADLKGRTVSVSTTGSLTDWLTRELSRSQGWGPEGIKVIGLGTFGAQTAALKTHQIDGMTVDLSTAYKLTSSGDGDILYRFGNLVKDFHIHVIYARKVFIAQKPEALRGFLAGWFESVDYMRAHKAETVAIAGKVMGTSPEISGKIYDELMPMFSTTGGHFNPKALDVLGRSYVEMGMLPKQPDMKTLITEDFLPPTAPAKTP